MTRARLASLLLAMTTLVACGGGDGDAGALASADDKLDDVTGATMRLEFASRALRSRGDASKPVGFRLSGPFSFEKETTYPVMELEYTRLAGDTEETVAVSSTGDEVFVERDGVRERVPASSLEGLRLGSGDETSGLGQLRLSEWVEDPSTARQGGDEIVTGKVDVAAVFADLGALAREMGVPDAGDVDLSDGDRSRLQELVRDSEVTIRTAADGDVLRAVDLRVELAPGTADDRPALASLSGAVITLSLTLDDVSLRD